MADDIFIGLVSPGIVVSLATRIESRLAESSKRAPDEPTGRANARPAALNLAEGAEYLTHIRASKPRASANCLAERTFPFSIRRTIHAPSCPPCRRRRHCRYRVCRHE